MSAPLALAFSKARGPSWNPQTLLILEPWLLSALRMSRGKRSISLCVFRPPYLRKAAAQIPVKGPRFCFPANSHGIPPLNPHGGNVSDRLFPGGCWRRLLATDPLGRFHHVFWQLGIREQLVFWISLLVGRGRFPPFPCSWVFAGLWVRLNCVPSSNGFGIPKPHLSSPPPRRVSSLAPRGSPRRVPTPPSPMPTLEVKLL